MDKIHILDETFTTYCGKGNPSIKVKGKSLLIHSDAIGDLSVICPICLDDSRVGLELLADKIFLQGELLPLDKKYAIIHSPLSISAQGTGSIAMGSTSIGPIRADINGCFVP